MSQITAELVKELRERTGVGMMDCKKALEAGNGDMDAAIKYLRETDFVAKTDDFIQLCKDLAMQIAATNPLAITPEEIDPAIIAREREISTNKAINDKKPENIIPKIVEGHIAKYCKEHALMDQEFIKDPTRNVKSLITDVVAKMGENIKLNRFARFAIGD
jgi:elongation factor Ts